MIHRFLLRNQVGNLNRLKLFFVSQKRIKLALCLFLYFLKISSCVWKFFITKYVLCKSCSIATRHFYQHLTYYKRNNMHWLQPKSCVEHNARMNTNEWNRILNGQKGKYWNVLIIRFCLRVSQILVQTFQKHFWMNESLLLCVGALRKMHLLCKENVTRTECLKALFQTQKVFCLG